MRDSNMGIVHMCTSILLFSDRTERNMQAKRMPWGSRLPRMKGRHAGTLPSRCIWSCSAVS